MIELRDVSKVYKNSKEIAVENVSVQIQKGEFFVLVGPFWVWEKYIIANDCRFRRNYFWGVTY